MTRCIGKACLDGPREGDEPMPRWADDGLLCPRCSGGLEQRLAELPARRDQLRAILGGLRSSQRGENRPTKGTPPVPLNLAAHDHLDLIQSTVVSWTQLVAEERGLRGPDRNDVGVLSSWLLSQHGWIVEQPWVDDLAEEMRDLSRVADRLTRVNPARHRLPAPCPVEKCQAHELWREDGSDHVACGACGGVWTEEQYPSFVRLALSENPDWITAQDAAKRLGVTYGTFRNLVSEHRVKKLGTVDGVARYRVADVDKMNQQEAS